MLCGAVLFDHSTFHARRESRQPRLHIMSGAFDKVTSKSPIQKCV